MKPIRLIARREWLATICSPTGLIIIGLYLVASGYIFWLNVSVTHEATLRYTFATLGLLTAFVVPLITMRLLSEELRSGTFEVLTSHPVTDLQIVLGKFLAAYAVFLSLSLPTLAYLFILQVFGSPDWGPALCAYLGQQLLALMLLAMGLLASALTANQVLAAMAATIGGVALWLASTASGSFEGWTARALAYLAMFEHFSVFRRGVVDTRALAYFVITAVTFLYLAVRAVESRRWKFGVLPGGMTARWSLPRLCILLLVLAVALLGESLISYVTHGLWGSYEIMLVAGGLLLAAMPVYLNRVRLRYELGRRKLGLILTVGVNCLLVLAIWGMAAFFTSRHYARADLTSTKHYALSPQTRSVISQLAQPVEIIVAMTAPTDLHQEISDLLAEYTAHSSQVTTKDIDPLRNPGDIDELRNRFKLTSPPSNEVLVAIGNQVRRLPVSSLIRKRVYIVDHRPVAGNPEFVGEAEITSTLIQLTRKAPGRVAFLSGHAERNPTEQGQDGASTVLNELRRGGWVVGNHVVTPGSNADFPPDTSVVVIAGPQKKLADEDLRAVTKVLDRGGGVLLLADPATNTGLSGFLQNWNIHLDNNMVVDLRDHLSGADPTNLYVTNFQQEHPIGKGMGTLAAVLPTAQRIAIMLNDRNTNVFPSNFMHTSGDGWAIAYEPGSKLKLDANRDKRGPISLGMACERFQEFAEPGRPPLQGRLVVIGDSDFITNRYVDMAGNLNLFLNCIDWLAGRQDLVSMRPKVADIRIMQMTALQSKTIFWLSVLGVPGAAMFMGLLGIIQRRRRA